MKTLYCNGCTNRVMELKEGSKIRKGAVVYCASCETKRKAKEFLNANRKPDVFGGLFNGGGFG